MNKVLLIQASACTAETITYPIDYIKTQIQINNYGIIKNKIRDRPLIMYRGLKPSLLRHCIYTVLRINIYELSRDNINSNKFIIGVISGGLSQLISNPFDLLKVRLISNESSLIPTIKSIYKDGGILGFWKGSIPNISRAILVNFGELATYDYSKQTLKKYVNIEEGTGLHILSSGCSGFISALSCTPADVIKSRMMQTNCPYNNIFDCIKTSVRNEGITTLYKGFIPIWIRLAPWQMTFWITYEKLRYFNNLNAF